MAPAYTSRYDTSPLPDPGDGKGDDAPPQSVDLPKGLRVNWSGPQPLKTVTPAGPGGGSGGSGSPTGGSSSGGGTGADGSSGGGGGGGQTPPDQAQVYDQSILDMFGPQYPHIKVEPELLLNLEQPILDKAREVVAKFEEIRATSEAALDAGWWGMNQVSGGKTGSGGAMGSTMNVENAPTDDANAGKKFAEMLRPMQRSALQHTANMMTMSGTFVQLLNSTADTYASADQYSVFPDKSEISKEADQ